MATFVSDLADAVRRLARARGFAFVAAGVLALGIGATTALVALVKGVVLRWKPSVLGGVALVVGATALVASLVPALRAYRTPPAEAFRDA